MDCMEADETSEPKMRLLEATENESSPNSNMDIPNPPPLESSVEYLLQKLLMHEYHEMNSNDIEAEIAWWKSNERKMLEDMICSQDETIIHECVDQLLRIMRSMSIEDMAMSWKDNFILKLEITWVHVLVAVIRFVRILLRHSPKRVGTSNKDTLNNESTTVQYSISLLDELSKCIKTSLTNVTNTVTTASSSSTICIPKNKQIAAFTLTLYLRLFDPNCLYSCILLLPVVWRNICDIFILLFSDPKVMEIHMTLVELCGTQLMQYLSDMERQIHSLLFPQLRSDRDTSKPWDELLLHNNVKIIIFFIARLYSISSILISSLHTTNQRHDTLKVNLIMLLCRFKGFIGATSVMLQSKGIGSGDTSMTLMDHLSKIEPKVDPCLERLFLYKKDATKESSAQTSAAQSRTTFYEGMIPLLLTLGDTLNISSNLERDDEETLAHGSLIIGYTRLLIFILKTHTKIQMDEVLQNKHLRVNRVLIDNALTICERLLFQLFPRYQPWLVISKNRNNRTKIALSEGIESIVDCTFTCHRTLSLVGDSTSINHTIIRWLCTRLQEHPISIQTTIVIAHMHIVRLIHHDFCCGHSYCSANDLIMLLSSLLFDRRTDVTLRRNIAFLLCRLLRYDNQEHNAEKHTISKVEEIKSSLTQKAIYNGLLASNSSLNNREGKGKRKRDTSKAENNWTIDTINFDPIDLECICLVIRMAFAGSNFGSHADISLKGFMTYQYNMILQSAKIISRLKDFSRSTSLYPAQVRRQNNRLNTLLVAVACLQSILSSPSSIDDVNLNHLFTHYIAIVSHFISNGNVHNALSSDVGRIILQTVQMALCDDRLYFIEHFLNNIPTSSQKLTSLSFALKYRALSLIASIAHMIPSDASNEFLSVRCKSRFFPQPMKILCDSFFCFIFLITELFQPFLFNDQLMPVAQYSWGNAIF